MSDLIKLARHEVAAPLVLVTLVSVEGSSYRKVGARMLVHAGGYHGLVSGGCLESEIARRCEPLKNGRTRTLSMRLDTRQYLGCDGRLHLWCEVVEPSLLKTAREVARLRQRRFCNTYPGEENRTTSITVEPDPDAFVEELLPPRRLLVFGATPDSEPVLSVANALGWQARRYVLAGDPGAAGAENILSHVSEVDRLQVDSTTACVVMNHHFGRDLDLLQALWNTDTPFVGLLGSRKRRDTLLEKLAFLGTIDLDSRELYAPVGLDLGGERPEEIALEICAQVQKVMARNRPGCRSREAHRDPSSPQDGNDLNEPESTASPLHLL